MSKKKPKVVNLLNRRSHNTYMAFRQFLLGRQFLATAVGVVIGANFSDFVKNFINLFYGLGAFLGKASKEGHVLDWQVIPFAAFIQSCFSLLAVALVLFFIIQIINTTVAQTPEEKFGYNYYLAQMESMQKQQEISNQLLQQLVDEKKANR